MRKNLADEIPALSLLSLLKTTDVSSTINLKNISSIDTKKNNSLSSLDITTTYYDKGLASFFEQKNKSSLTCKLKPQEASNLGIYTEFYYPHDFVPKIEPQQLVSLTYTPASFKKVLLGDGEGESEFEIVNEANFTGLFKHSLDLKKFPFDKQVIGFMFKIDNDYALLTNPKIDQYQTESFKQELVDFNLTEWDIKDSTFAYFGDIYESDEEVFVPTLIVGFYIDRKSNYYVFKILLPILIILIISWSVFWIRPQELESRITISIVCMLSLIAYNFVIDSDMPKLEYLTIMDYIILISFLSLNVGITHDEVHNLEVWKIKSKIYSNFLFNTDYEVVFPDAGMQYYGIGFHIFSYPFELFFRNILVFFDYSDDAILLISKHPSIVIIFAISGVFFRNIIFLITKNKFYSNITAVFYLVYPYILGHSFFNFKDIPFMSLWVICTYLFMVISKKLYNKEKIYFLELSTFAFLTAFLLSVRVSGILILVEYFIFIIFVIHFSKIEIINFIKSVSNKLLIFLSIFVMSFYLLHPSFWSDPSSLLEAFKYMSKHIQTVCTITFGTCMKAQNLPSSYIPLWLLIKLPILTLLSFLLFPIVEKKIFSKNLNTIFIGPLILTPFLIVLLLIIFNVNLYDELRQILFIVPLILLASFSVLFF